MNGSLNYIVYKFVLRNIYKNRNTQNNESFK